MYGLDQIHLWAWAKPTMGRPGPWAMAGISPSARRAAAPSKEQAEEKTVAGSSWQWLAVHTRSKNSLEFGQQTPHMARSWRELEPLWSLESPSDGLVEPGAGQLCRDREPREGLYTGSLS